MEDKNLTPAEELKNNIDSAIETKATEVATKGADALEAKAIELNEALETKTMELQKQIDEVKTMKNETLNIGKAKGSEFQEMLREKANEISQMKEGGKVTLDLKTFTGSAGVGSAPYGDERVSEIKHDPNFYNRVRNNILTGSTSQTGAIRHSFETAETDSSAGKVKGSAQPQSAVTLTDVHTPIVTLFNLLTLPQEQADDIEMIESYLSTRLMSNLMDVEDVQLLRGTGVGANYSGLATGASSFATAAARETFVGGLADQFGTAANEYDVITAVAAGLANRNFMADKVFLNPLDYYSMVTRKASTNEYVMAQTVAPNGEFMTIWNGVEIVKTPAQTAGTFTILDSKKSSQYWMREGSQIEFGMNEADFASNNISVRASIRGALTNYYAQGIVSDTFANFRAALNS